MAKVKSNLNNLIVRLEKSIRSRTMLDEIGKFAKDRIFQYTKRGFSLAVKDKPTKLKELSEGYKRYRKRIADGTRRPFKGKQLKEYRLGSFFSPKRSNLTMTGQMLDALKYEIDTSKGTATVSVKPTARSGDDLTNLEVAKKVATDGRPFLGLDDTGKERIKQMILRDLRRKLKR